MALIDARLFDQTSQSDIQVLNLKSIQSKVLNTFQIKFINQSRIGKLLFSPEYCKITFNGNINHIENLKGELSPDFVKLAFNKTLKTFRQEFFTIKNYIGG
jgi:hypothetical protein